jgi:uncharacterized protein YegP (UPF0339 family)
MAAKFEISKDHAGKFRFHLKAPNGEIIAASQGYETKANAEKGGGNQDARTRRHGGRPNRLATRVRPTAQRQFPSNKVYRRDDRGVGRAARSHGSRGLARPSHGPANRLCGLGRIASMLTRGRTGCG